VTGVWLCDVRSLPPAEAAGSSGVAAGFATGRLACQNGFFTERGRMANYTTNEFRSGLKILLDGDPYAIV
jgi:hypothetical protein